MLTEKQAGVVEQRAAGLGELAIGSGPWPVRPVARRRDVRSKITHGDAVGSLPACPGRGGLLEESLGSGNHRSGGRRRPTPRRRRFSHQTGKTPPRRQGCSSAAWLSPSEPGLCSGPLCVDGGVDRACVARRLPRRRPRMRHSLEWTARPRVPSAARPLSASSRAATMLLWFRCLSHARVLLFSGTVLSQSVCCRDESVTEAEKDGDSKVCRNRCLMNVCAMGGQKVAVMSRQLSVSVSTRECLHVRTAVSWASEARPSLHSHDRIDKWSQYTPWSGPTKRSAVIFTQLEPTKSLEAGIESLSISDQIRCSSAFLWGRAVPFGLSSSPDEHHPSYSCLGTNMRVGKRKPLLSSSCIFGPSALPMSLISCSVLALRTSCVFQHG